MVLETCGSGMVVGSETAVNVRVLILEELSNFHHSDKDTLCSWTPSSFFLHLFFYLNPKTP